MNAFNTATGAPNRRTQPDIRSLAGRSALALLVAVPFLALSAQAAPDTPLTSDRVSRFLDSLPDFEALGEKYGDEGQQPPSELGRKKRKNTKRRMQQPPQGIEGLAQAQEAAMPTADQMKRAGSPFTSGLEEMRSSEGYDEMVATVKRHGFSSVEEWASVGDRAVRAFAATKMKQQAPEMNAQMEEMRKNLAQSGMPKAQQDAMLEMVDSTRETMKTFQDVPEADKKAVAPHLDRFEALSESNGRKPRRR